MPLGQAGIQAKLHQGLALDEFVLHYQPQFHASSVEPVALEALVRWDLGEGGLVLPTRFMPAVADSGLSMEMLERILNLACAQGKAWREEGFRPIKIAINLSAEQLNHADLCPIIDSVLNAARPSIPWLELELPAWAAFDADGRTLRVLYQLKDRGFPLALDNYGRNRTDMGTLVGLPIDKVKIDKSLTRLVGVEGDAARAVRRLVDLKSNLDITLLAAGVEKEEESRLLTGWGFHLLQGNLLSPALPPDQAARAVLGEQRQKEDSQLIG